MLYTIQLFKSSWQYDATMVQMQAFYSAIHAVSVH
ncbi:protein of unknown function [Trichlorobacter ammonificans]|uniref:Uncharacterized protein n=1 Tax=Trichlorobacter ammonificans TaxID=2916410 RepID=A0ABM9D9X3_9BACT|nr:protein of unknown function [Trichlorobacter ammonificans]